MTIIDSTTLKRATAVAAEIEKRQAEILVLKSKLDKMLGTSPKHGQTTPQVKKVSTDSVVRGSKVEAKKAKIEKPKAEKSSASKLAGKPRPVSPSGPLAPAVVKVLKRYGRPMKVNEILIALEHDNYAWTAKNPRQTLYVRIGKLHGVQKTPDGLYSPDTSVESAPVIPVTTTEVSAPAPIEAASTETTEIAPAAIPAQLETTPAGV